VNYGLTNDRRENVYCSVYCTVVMNMCLYFCSVLQLVLEFRDNYGVLKLEMQLRRVNEAKKNDGIY